MELYQRYAVDRIVGASKACPRSLQLWPKDVVDSIRVQRLPTNRRRPADKQIEYRV
jgi:hypothetical protein